MKCQECGKVFRKEENRAERIDGTKIIVCPNCGDEPVSYTHLTLPTIGG